MSWQFTASLTLGALVVWLAVECSIYKRRLRRLAKADRQRRMPRLPALLHRIIATINRPAA